MNHATETAEQVLRFGPHQRLLGILNRRTSDAPVVCLLVNVGVTQRIGPRRLNVKLARALGTLSIASLRFDFAGLGDSGAADAGDDYRHSAVADLRAAMDHLEQGFGIRRFIILGICSGAVNGLRAAQADARVAGLMMFDGYAYPTWKTRLVHDWQRLRTTPPQAVVGKVRQRLRKLLGMPTPESPVSIFYATSDGMAPDRRQFADTLDALSGRGVRLLIAYSGSLLALYNHESQFQTTFAGHAFLPVTTHRYLPHIDHIPTSLEAQHEFIAVATDWVGRSVISVAADAR